MRNKFCSFSYVPSILCFILVLYFHELILIAKGVIILRKSSIFLQLFCFRSSRKMLYETRKVIVGFRLKLNFDLSLNKDMSCIFVEVSKTATVGLLLNNIIERFKIPHNSFLTVQNCKVLPSESVYVLLDITSAK